MDLTLGHWLWIAFGLMIFLPTVYWDAKSAADALEKRMGE